MAALGGGGGGGEREREREREGEEDTNQVKKKRMIKRQCHVYNLLHCRAHKKDDYDHYTKNQTLFINKIINNTITNLKKMKTVNTLELEHYLRHS